MGMQVELVDGVRFERAWTRFRKQFPEDDLGEEHRDMLQQVGKESHRWYRQRSTNSVTS